MTAVFDEHRFGYWRCDNCGRTLSAVAGVEPVLPPPWREREIAGYVGTFHVCSDRCEEELPLTVAARASGAD
jgi:hypothetical protein